MPGASYRIRTFMRNKKLSPAKRALLEKWRQGQVGEQGTSIPKCAEGHPIPLSFPQRRRLFLELLDRDTAVNNLSLFLELKGRLDLDAFTESANRILVRHEVLRTRFMPCQGMLTPEVLPACRVSIIPTELKSPDEKENTAEARRLAEQDALRPFDLNQAPLIRFRLFKVSEEKHFFLLLAHHTIADGWSMGIFLKELMLFYRAAISGQAAQAPELPIQYSDFACWQNDPVNQGRLFSSRSYWKKVLGGELPMLELPTDKANANRRSFRGGSHRFTLSPELTRATGELSRQEDATLFMGLLSAFFIMLHRYSGQEDILVGTPVANRTLPELEPLIGVFINTLALRADLKGDPSYRAWLRKVRELCLDAYAHQKFPFEKLLEELKPSRNLDRPPLFQVVFILQNSPLPELDIPGLDITIREIDRVVTQYDLTLIVTRANGELQATMEYNADRFRPATVARMARSFQWILENAIKEPDLPISGLRWISRETFEKAVYGRNRTRIHFPREKCIHQLIEEQVERTPQAVALLDGNTQITYAGLNRRANALARRLQEHGIGPDVRVGVLMKKSPAIAWVLLGILKAGGAYVPIHIASPPERINFMLEESDAKILLTNLETGPLPAFRGSVIRVRDEEADKHGSETNPRSGVHAGHLAYIIYTSGSTGRPKGVMIQHASLLNFLWSMRDRPGFDSNSVFLALASISFDISTLEYFLPLMIGAKTVIASEEMTRNPVMIGEAIDKHQVNVLQATTATWQLLLDSPWPGREGLTALCGGDILTRTMADQILDRVGSLWNMYGPTETTVWCMGSRILKNGAPITIGEPIGNMRVYILDRYLQPVPIGVIGELHIGGEGLARAYLNSPELTREKFIADPFRTEADGLMYRTGDLARYLPDHEMEILGRADDQVKVQGHRIELGEIRATLLRHPSVNDGLVIAHSGTRGEKRLVAYVVPGPDGMPQVQALREFLAKKLPAYMIPAFFIPMDSLPLTPNGKVDRKALPVPEDNTRPAGYAAPRNKEEEIMATIWENVLEVEPVGIHDNFFDLGGASIQSIQVVAKANMYGYPLKVEHLFEYQTIAELATAIREASP